MDHKVPPDSAFEENSNSWLITFADLMALLLAFFVLLFSFSTLDEQRYQEMANAFSDSFSVFENPNSSLVEPIKPRNQTDQENQIVPGSAKRSNDLGSESLNALSAQLKVDLANELSARRIALEALDDGLVIRLDGDTSFKSGSAEIETRLFPALDRIGAALAQTQGQIEVSGHTDNRPIFSGLYSSNWDLSAARAVAVTEHLLVLSQLEPTRFKVVGRAETQPLAFNNTPENRARNRRVEILFLPQGD